MRVDSAFWTGKGQRRFGAASSRFWDEGAVGQGEKGLQDKGSASSALLSVCLHIFLLRDRVSLEGDSCRRNGINPPLSLANREQRPRSFSYHRAVAEELLVGALLS